MSEPFFSVEFPSTIEAMIEALDRAVATLLERGWVAPDKCCWARLCLEEAFSNAVRHGNHLDPSRKVRVAFHAIDDMCCMEVQDEGCGFALDSVRPAEPTQLGGRGICLMKYFMSSVTYNKDRHCLSMTMSRKQCCPDRLGGEEEANHDSE